MAICDEEVEEVDEYAVIDTGAATTRAGRSGYDAPQVDFPTVVGHHPNDIVPRFPRDVKPYYVGVEAVWKQPVLTLKYPIVDEHLWDYDELEKLWTHCFDNELRICIGDPDHPEDEDVKGVLFSEPPEMPQDAREYLTHLMFEKFGARSFFLESTALLALLASGRKTGMVVESGEQSLRVVPIYDCCTVREAVRRQRGCGGRDLDELFCRILCEQPTGLHMHTGPERELAKEMKEKLCYVSLNFAEEVDNFAGKQKTFELPDGTSVAVHNPLIRCPELLFSPSTFGVDAQPLHQLAEMAASACPSACQRDLFGNVILAGGNTMFPHLPERLQAELQKLAPEQVKVIAPPERMIMTWIGGSILTSLSAFDGMAIQRSMFEDVGPRIVHQMCNPRVLRKALNPSAEEEEEEET